MSKELVISATPHETRVAIVEDGQLCEIYIEREKEFALVGSLYKGRVTRVLPGMQSAFVDIGLDSDAFLYVSDFLEHLEDYDHVAAPVEAKVQKMQQQGGEVFPPSTINGGITEPAAVSECSVPPEAAATPFRACDRCRGSRCRKYAGNYSARGRSPAGRFGRRANRFRRAVRFFRPAQPAAVRTEPQSRAARI